jgi:hypothetical protein
MLRIPDPSLIIKEISGRYLRKHLSPSYDRWHCIINGIEKYSDWY